VVLPASMWAMMPMLRTFEMGTSLAIICLLFLNKRPRRPCESAPGVLDQNGRASWDFRPDCAMKK
jgi:hypothetical protein